jgi:hypothetical protein
MLHGNVPGGNRADILRRKCRGPRWALGSGIEALTSVIVVWRFTWSRMVSETFERRAQRALQLLAAGPYIAIQAICDLAAHHPASPTPWVRRA